MNEIDAFEAPTTSLAAALEAGSRSIPPITARAASMNRPGVYHS